MMLIVKVKIKMAASMIVVTKVMLIILTLCLQM